MIALDFVPLTTYVIATIFSPGPNNLYSATLGINQGYKSTLPFLMGVGSGYFVLMMLCAFASTQLMQAFPAVQEGITYVGAGYIVYLAYATMRSELKSDDNAQPLQHAYVKGALLQLVNPKAIIFGFTLFSTLLAPLNAHVTLLAVAAITLSLLTFIAVSLWAMFGAIARQQLDNPKTKLKVKWTLGALLIYNAINLLSSAP